MGVCELFGLGVGDFGEDEGRQRGGVAGRGGGVLG